MMLLEAVAFGSASKGALLLFTFGLGTMPMLILTGFFSNFLTNSIRSWGDKLLTVGVFVLAIMLLVRGAGYDVLMFGHTHSSTSTSHSSHHLEETHCK
jgi:sulfite exporter TauE/SafE